MRKQIQLADIPLRFTRNNKSMKNTLISHIHLAMILLCCLLAPGSAIAATANNAESLSFTAEAISDGFGAQVTNTSQESMQFSYALAPESGKENRVITEKSGTFTLEPNQVWRLPFSLKLAQTKDEEVNYIIIKVTYAGMSKEIKLYNRREYVDLKVVGLRTRCINGGQFTVNQSGKIFNNSPYQLSVDAPLYDNREVRFRVMLIKSRTEQRFGLIDPYFMDINFTEISRQSCIVEAVTARNEGPYYGEFFPQGSNKVFFDDETKEWVLHFAALPPDVAAPMPAKANAAVGYINLTWLADGKKTDSGSCQIKVGVNTSSISKQNGLIVDGFGYHIDPGKYIEGIVKLGFDVYNASTWLRNGSGLYTQVNRDGSSPITIQTQSDNDSLVNNDFISSHLEPITTTVGHNVDKGFEKQKISWVSGPNPNLNNNHKSFIEFTPVLGVVGTANIKMTISNEESSVIKFYRYETTRPPNSGEIEIRGLGEKVDINDNDVGGVYIVVPFYILCGDPGVTVKIENISSTNRDLVAINNISLYQRVITAISGSRTVALTETMASYLVFTPTVGAVGATDISFTVTNGTNSATGVFGYATTESTLDWKHPPSAIAKGSFIELSALADNQGVSQIKYSWTGTGPDSKPLLFDNAKLADFYMIPNMEGVYTFTCNAKDDFGNINGLTSIKISNSSIQFSEDMLSSPMGEDNNAVSVVVPLTISSQMSSHQLITANVKVTKLDENGAPTLYNNYPIKVAEGSVMNAQFNLTINRSLNEMDKTQYFECELTSVNNAALGWRSHCSVIFFPKKDGDGKGEDGSGGWGDHQPAIGGVSFEIVPASLTGIKSDTADDKTTYFTKNGNIQIKIVVSGAVGDVQSTVTWDDGSQTVSGPFSNTTISLTNEGIKTFTVSATATTSAGSVSASAGEEKVLVFDKTAPSVLNVISLTDIKTPEEKDWLAGVDLRYTADHEKTDDLILLNTNTSENNQESRKTLHMNVFKKEDFKIRMATDGLSDIWKGKSVIKAKHSSASETSEFSLEQDAGKGFLIATGIEVDDTKSDEYYEIKDCEVADKCGNVSDELSDSILVFKSREAQTLTKPMDIFGGKVSPVKSICPIGGDSFGKELGLSISAIWPASAGTNSSGSTVNELKRFRSHEWLLGDKDQLTYSVADFGSCHEPMPRAGKLKRFVMRDYYGNIKFNADLNVVLTLAQDSFWDYNWGRYGGCELVDWGDAIFNGVTSNQIFFRPMNFIEYGASYEVGNIYGKNIEGIGFWGMGYQVYYGEEDLHRLPYGAEALSGFLFLAKVNQCDPYVSNSERRLKPGVISAPASWETQARLMPVKLDDSEMVNGFLSRLDEWAGDSRPDYSVTLPFFIDSKPVDDLSFPDDLVSRSGKVKVCGEEKVSWMTAGLHEVWYGIQVNEVDTTSVGWSFFYGDNSGDSFLSDFEYVMAFSEYLSALSENMLVYPDLNYWNTFTMLLNSVLEEDWPLKTRTNIPANTAFKLATSKYGTDMRSDGSLNNSQSWANVIKLSPDIVAVEQRVQLSLRANFIDYKNTKESVRAKEKEEIIRFLDGEDKISLMRLDDTAPQEGDDTKIIIVDQRLLLDGPESTTCQTVLLDVIIGSKVDLKLLNVDVRLGCVKAYSDELSQNYAGANGAHRMKEALAIIRVDLVDRDNQPLAAAPLYRAGPQMKLTGPTAIPGAGANRRRSITVTGEWSDDLFPPAQVQVNHLAVPIQRSAQPLENGKRLTGTFTTTLDYSRDIDIPIRARMTNALWQFSEDSRLLLFERRNGFAGVQPDGPLEQSDYKIGGGLEPADGDDIRSLPGLQVSDLYPSALAERGVVSPQGRRPASTWDSTVDPYVRLVVEGPPWLGSSPTISVPVTWVPGEPPVTTTLYRTSDGHYSTPLLVLYDELGAQGTDLARLADTGAQVSETIAGTAHTMPVSDVRIRTALGHHPIVGVTLPAGVQNFTTKAMASGLRLVVENGQWRHLADQLLPAAGCELGKSAASKRDNFVVEAASPTWDVSTAPDTVDITWETKAYVPQSGQATDQEVNATPNSGNEYPTQTQVALNPFKLERVKKTALYRTPAKKRGVAAVEYRLTTSAGVAVGGTSGSGSVDPSVIDYDGKVSTKNAMLNRRSVLTPCQLDGTPDASLKVDPDISILLVPSAGTLRLKGPVDSNLLPYVQQLRPKRYMTMGDSLTEGFQHGVCRGPEQVFGHGAQTAGQMGIPFRMPLITESAGYPNGITMEQDMLEGTMFAFQFKVTAADMDSQRLKSHAGLSYPQTNPGYHDNVGVTGYTVLNLLTNQYLEGTTVAQSQAVLPIESALGVMATQPQVALRLRPSLVTCWIGANDALGTVTSGQITDDGYSTPYTLGRSLVPGNLTSIPRFRFEYRALAEQMKALQDAFGTDLLFGQVPQVVNAPTLVPWTIERDKSLESFPQLRHDDAVALGEVDGALCTEQGNILGQAPFGYNYGVVLQPWHDTNQDSRRLGRAMLRVDNDYFQSWGGIGTVDEVRMTAFRQSVVGVSYLHILMDEVLAPHAIPVRWFNVGTEVDVHWDAFFTRNERDYCKTRVDVFNGIIDQSVSSVPNARILNVSGIFADIARGRYVYNGNGSSMSLWGQTLKDPNNADERTLPDLEEAPGTVIRQGGASGLNTRSTSNKLIGGAFGADLVHPGSVGYSVVADAITDRIRTAIADGAADGFGGFRASVPRIYKNQGSCRLTAVGGIDRHFQELIKRRNNMAHYDSSNP